MRKFPIYLLLEVNFLDTPRCSIGAINHLHRGEVSTYFPHGLYRVSQLKCDKFTITALKGVKVSVLIRLDIS